MTTAADVDRAIDILDKRQYALDSEVLQLTAAGPWVCWTREHATAFERVMAEREELGEQRRRMLAIREQMDAGKWAAMNRGFCQLLHRGRA